MGGKQQKGKIMKGMGEGKGTSWSVMNAFHLQGEAAIKRQLGNKSTFSQFFI